MARSILPKVADVYLAACENGEPPTAAVRKALKVSQSTAGLYVSKARLAGLLPAAAPGSSPRRNAKVVKVALSIGVPYDVLEAAIIRHADGDIRVTDGA